MSSKDDILALLADGSEWSAAAIREALPTIKPDTIAWALGSLVEGEQLERIKPGFYRVRPGTEKRERPPSVRTRFTPSPEPQEQSAEATEPDTTTDAPEPLQWALWHDGDLMLRRGEATVVLTAAEVADLTRRLARLQEVVA